MTKFNQLTSLPFIELNNGSGVMEGGRKLSVNVRMTPTMTELDRSTATTASNFSSSDGGGQLAIDFSSRFVPYTTLSIVCLLFNSVALAALCFVRGPRTVHHRLLANLTVGDVVGTVLLWLYYNSPYIFPRFEVNRLISCCCC